MSTALNEIPDFDDYNVLFGFLWSPEALSNYDSMDDFLSLMNESYWLASETLRAKLESAHKAHDLLVKSTALRSDRQMNGERSSDHQSVRTLHENLLFATSEVERAESVFVKTLYRLRVIEAMAKSDYEEAHRALQDYKGLASK